MPVVGEQACGRGPGVWLPGCRRAPHRGGQGAEHVRAARPVPPGAQDAGLHACQLPLAPTRRAGADSQTPELTPKYLYRMTRMRLLEKLVGFTTISRPSPACNAA